MLGTELLRIGQFGIVDVGSDNPRSFAGCRRDDTSADGATTDHQDIINLGHPAPIRRVIPDAQGFDQG